MSAGPLPHIVNFRALASRDVFVSGHLAIANLERLTSAVDGREGRADVEAQFHRDENGRFVCELSVKAVVSVLCQRCLEPMDVALGPTGRVAAVWSESQLDELPESLDGLVTEDETDLWLMVEEELLLALPAYPAHEDPDCAVKVGRVLKQQPVEEIEAEVPNSGPFAVLAALQRGDTDEA